MKDLPADKTCIKSSFLCSSCKQKLEDNVISQFDLDIARDLLEIETKYPSLEKASLYKTIDFGDVVILVIGNEDRIKFTEQIQKDLKKKHNITHLILVEKSKKIRQLVESLISPGKMIGLNEIFVPTGDVEYKAIINKNDREKILFVKEELEELVEEISGKVIRFSFE